MVREGGWEERVRRGWMTEKVVIEGVGNRIEGMVNRAPIVIEVCGLASMAEQSPGCLWS